jgi:hypothetical protein
MYPLFKVTPIDDILGASTGTSDISTGKVLKVLSILNPLASAAYSDRFK